MCKRRQTLTFIGYFLNLSLHNFSFSLFFAVCVRWGGGVHYSGLPFTKKEELKDPSPDKINDMYYMPNKFILMS